MLTVIITNNDGTQDMKECWKIEDLSLVGVVEVKIIRDERTK